MSMEYTDLRTVVYYPAWTYFVSAELDRGNLGEWDTKRLARAWRRPGTPSRLVKIRFSANLPARLKELRERPNRTFLRMDTLRLEHAIWAASGRAAERQLHDRLRDRRVSGEWFALAPEDLLVLRRVRAYDGERFHVLDDLELDEEEVAA